jgi:putative SOS response-associated peptidase YedK
VDDRRPAILKKKDYERWFVPRITDPKRVIDCLTPFDPKLMKKYPVSSRASRPENDNQGCAQETPISIAAPTLF